jgi:MFS family permease
VPTIVPTVSLLCSVHVGEPLDGIIVLNATEAILCSFLLGIGVGAEYPCGSVAASEQSEEEGIAKNAQHRWFALATSAKHLRHLQPPVLVLTYFPRYHDRLRFRYLLICAPGSVLDVGAFLAAFFGPLRSFTFDLHRFGNKHLRAVWRLSLGLGTIPALAVLLWRMNMQNPSHYKKNSMRDTRIPYWLIIRRYWVNLLAISLTWFIYDFITCVCSIYH